MTAQREGMTATMHLRHGQKHSMTLLRWTDRAASSNTHGRRTGRKRSQKVKPKAKVDCRRDQEELLPPTIRGPKSRFHSTSTKLSTNEIGLLR